MRTVSSKLGPFLVVLLASGSARADVALPRLLTDHMVLQRDRPVHIWGKADPGEQVAVALEGRAQTARADDLGRWSVYLSPLPAGGPYEISIQANNSIKLHDVLIGDVWLASGQSNMEFKLSQDESAPVEIPAAQHPRIRFFGVDRKASSYPLDDVTSKAWLICAPEAAGEFSAVACFFARDLQKDADVPIGVIDTSWGGAPLAAFTGMNAISKDAGLMPVFAQWGRMMENEGTTLLNIEKENRDFANFARAGEIARKAGAAENLALGPRLLGSRRHLQRNDRPGDSLRHSRRHLVSGGERCRR